MNPSNPTAPAGQTIGAAEYLTQVAPLIERLGEEPTLGRIRAAGAAVAATLAGGGRVWLAETTHCLHGEATYRAGGLVAVHTVTDPVLVEPGDCVIEGSPVGTSGLAVDLALKVKQRGATLIALTNVAFEVDARTIVEHPSGRRLHEIADVVVDLAGPVGDGVFPHPDEDFRVIPHSGVIGMTAMWMIFAEAVAVVGSQGSVPHVYECVMVEGAGERNARARGEYLAVRSGVRALRDPSSRSLDSRGE
jgi:uncharacterized phosphosugar-binding protein